MPRNGLQEKDFEADIEKFLISEEGGYVKGNQKSYDKSCAIDIATLVQFLKDTQPAQWRRFENNYHTQAREQLKQRFNTLVEQHGLIAVLRKGISDLGVSFHLYYPTPTSSLNPDVVKNHEKNILTCTRQFAYSTLNNNTIDMVLSLNGIPMIAIELKNQLTGQSVENSIRQWREDRNPNELLFRFNKRIIAFFGADLYNVVMTTELKGRETFFIPFDQGSNGAGKEGGKGNPPKEDSDYVTSYLWKNVLQRDKFFSIIDNYVMVQKETKLEIIIDKHGTEKETSKEEIKLIFPRYHQFDVVEKLVKDSIEKGSGTNYLIQHSAGSGKSNSIAWLTYRLATLHNAQNERIFNGVFIVTDRRVLNRQLRDTILSFEHEESQITTITENDSTSVLEKAINDEKQIIVTTIQRFPIVYERIGNRAGKRYAIIVDEAHSSQSGKSAAKMNATLADTDEALEEWAKLEERTAEEMEQQRDALMEDLLAQGRHGNLSFYAFTATPKPKTLQTFGQVIHQGATPNENQYGPYHIYSMQQAIEEGFILDVLDRYTTYDVRFELDRKLTAQNEEYKERPTVKALLAFYGGHQDTINKKSAIIVEKFREVTLNQMNGKAKAMVVTASRMHALRYYLTIKKYCEKNNITDVNPLVAFSGSLTYGGKDYTETKLNSSQERQISEEKLPLYFASDLYNLLIVADKYQTGFDEPKLHTMFVDKKLKGVKAVQTLSRLNRSCKGKEDTYVFDFINEAEDIKKSFEPFYTSTKLIEPVDFNCVTDFRDKIKDYHLWSAKDEETFYSQYADLRKSSEESRLAKISNIYAPVITKYKQLLKLDDKLVVRSLISNFVRFYSFMAQILRTYDRELYKTYLFTYYLNKVLPKNPREHVDINEKVLLINSKIEENAMITISVEGKPEVKERIPDPTPPPVEKSDLLDNIIKKLNTLYQGNFSSKDVVIVERIIDKIQANAGKKIVLQAKNSEEKQFVESIFPGYFDPATADCYEEQSDLFQKLYTDPNLYNTLRHELGTRLYATYRRNGARI